MRVRLAVVSAFVLAIALSFGGAAVAQPVAAATSQQIVKKDTLVTTKTVVLESKPRTSSNNVARLAKRTKVTTTANDSKGWVRVKVASGKAKGKTGYLKVGSLRDVWDTAAKPALGGHAYLGETLWARNESFAEAGNWYVPTTYQWLRNGKKITGATANSYEVKRADKGTRLSLRVTGRLKGLPPTTLTSARTAKITAWPKPKQSDIDRSSEESVRKAMKEWLLPAQHFLRADAKPVVGAKLSTCVTGRLSSIQRSYSTSLVNFFRELAGVPPVGYLTSLETGTMNAAVLNSVNGRFDHAFSKKTNPKCWTKLSKNTTHNILYSGSGLAWNIPGWIDDNANVADNVGHRTALLEDSLTHVAFGVTAGGGVASGVSTRQSEAEPTGDGRWSWPASGWFPRSLAPTRWSFDLGNDAYWHEEYTDATDAEGGLRPGGTYTTSELQKATVAVTHKGKKTTHKAHGNQWFRMPVGDDLGTGAYKITVTMTLRETTWTIREVEDDWGTVIDYDWEHPTERTVKKAYSYTVRVFAD